MASAALRALMLRAFVLWAVLRVIVEIASAFAAQAGETPPDSPIGIVLLCVVVAYIDVRRRQERALWANLGISLPIVAGIFGAIAVTGEVVLALLRR
jgi:hypothetical protein